MKDFYERLLPFAAPFMALFGRKILPHRATLSRFLAALDQSTVEALHSLFLEDLVVRTAQTYQVGCGIVWASTGSSWMWMALNKWYDNEPFPPLPSFPRPLDALIGSVLPPTSGASEGR